MQVTLNIPDKFFDEFIDNCSQKVGKDCSNVKSLIKNIKEYTLKNTVNESDDKLYMWLAALTFDDIISNYIKN